MGIDTKRFVNPLPQDFICPICNDVFDTPVQCPDEHIFCNDCISKWLLKIRRCPLDQNALNFTELTPTPRVFRNLLDNLELRCEFCEYGCHTTTTLECIQFHQINCKFRSVMECRTEELNLLREQIKELINDVTTMGNNTKLLNDALIETNTKLETATIAIDDLQVQVDNKNCKLVQLETKLETLEQTNGAEMKKFGSQLKQINRLVTSLLANQQITRKRESANASRTKNIAEITQEITASLSKLTSTLEEVHE